MFAASALSGWLRPTTSWAAEARSATWKAVTAPNTTTSRARTAPMIWSRPGSVVAAARRRSLISAQAPCRAGGGAGGGADCAGACVGAGTGAVRTFGGYVT